MQFSIFKAYRNNHTKCPALKNVPLVWFHTVVQADKIGVNQLFQLRSLHYRFVLVALLHFCRGICHISQRCLHSFIKDHIWFVFEIHKKTIMNIYLALKSSDRYKLTLKIANDRRQSDNSNHKLVSNLNYGSQHDSINRWTCLKFWRCL